MAPEIPVMLIKGENAKDRRVGAMVLLIMEQIPKVPPRIAPAKGPSKTAPKITGICTVEIGRASCRERVCQYV